MYVLSGIPNARARPKSMSCKHRRSCLDLGFIDARPTRNLEIARPVNQQILGLEITVQDSMGVAVIQALDQLVVEFLHRSAGAPTPPSSSSALLGAGRRSGTKRLAMTIDASNPRCGKSLGLSIVSMYFFKSMSRNSNTKYSLLSL